MSKQQVDLESEVASEVEPTLEEVGAVSEAKQVEEDFLDQVGQE